VDKNYKEALHTIPNPIMDVLDCFHVHFTASVRFECFSELKSIVEQRKCWRTIDREWPYFESYWKPKS